MQGLHVMRALSISHRAGSVGSACAQRSRHVLPEPVSNLCRPSFRPALSGCLALARDHCHDRQQTEADRWRRCGYGHCSARCRCARQDCERQTDVS